MSDTSSDDALMQTVLPQSALFADVDWHVVIEDLRPWSVRRIASGQAVLTPQQDNTELLILLEGEWIVTWAANAGQPIARIQPGDCVGELSLFDSQRPSNYVFTTQNSRYWAIDRSALWTLINRWPQIALNLLRIMAARSREKSLLLDSSLGLLNEYRARAETDALTGLHNRNWMLEIYPQQLELSLRIGHPVALLLIDVDHFKKINDQYGHAAGDQALQHLARVVQRNLRSTDLLARYGGEEFAVMMPATPIPKAFASAERLRRRIHGAPLMLAATGTTIHLTVSIGIAECLAGWTLDDLLHAADQALYQAKHHGRNQIRLWTTSFHT